MESDKSDKGSFESYIETLKRISEKRQKEAKTVNRGEQLKLQTECHEFEKKQRLFSMHLSSERSASQHALKELVAHRHVLSAIATNNMKQQNHDEKFGRYGEGAFKFALQTQIEAEKLRMDPMQRRKAMCKLLLQQRRERIERQRTLTTDQSSTKVQGRLIVPPIHARPLHRAYESPRKQTTADDHATSADRTITSANPSRKHPSTVFITQKAVTKI